MFCPNYKNKEVFDGFNEMIEAFGGKPMTEEEFRDSALRNLRTGTDFKAMEATYRLYHLNGGNFLDLAPNNKLSVLFQTLLGLYNGDRTKALLAKSKLYSEEFRNWFGDWIKVTKPYNRRTSKQATVRLNRTSGDKFNINPDTMQGVILTDTNGHSIFNAMGRTFVLCNVNGNVIPFYQSSKGTSGKTKGDWYPFFGYTGNWLIKGTIDSNGKMSYSSEIDRITNLLNKDFKIPTDFNNNGISESTGIDVKDLGLNMYSVFDRFGKDMKSVNTTDPNALMFYDKDLNELTNANALFVKEITGIKTQGIKQSHNSFSFIKPFIDATETANVSKVVDENGEPLVVWHNANDTYSEFDLNYSPNGFYFGTQEQAFARADMEEDYHPNGMLIQAFLNLRNPKITNFDDRDINKYKNSNDGFIIEVSKEGAEELASIGNYNPDNFRTEYVVFNPNQIKSVFNNGDFSTTNDNIYKLEAKSDAFLDLYTQYDLAYMPNTFGPELTAKLLDGLDVSSKDLVLSMIQNGSFDGININLAKILSKHDIPIKLDNSLGNNTLAETVTDSNGGSVILINGNLIQEVSKNYASITLLHEITHSVTVNAINKPITSEQKDFVLKNRTVYNLLRNAFKGREYLLNSSEYGAYALTNEKEFAVVYITDVEVRKLMNALARQLDIEKNGKVVASLKRFINSASNLLINKSLFQSNEALIDEYKKMFDAFLSNQKEIKNGGIISKSKLKEIYKLKNNNTEDTEAVIEATKEINQFVDTIEYNKLIQISRKKEQGSISNITSKLQTRRNALRTSNLEVSKKQSALNVTNNLIDMYTNSNTPRYIALRSTVSLMVPQLLEDLDYLRDLHESEKIMSSSEYMYQTHSNFKMFDKVFDEIDGIFLDNNQILDIIREYNTSDKVGGDISISEIEEIRQDISNIRSCIKNAIIILNSQNNKINAKIITEKALKADSIEGVEYAAKLLTDYKFDDISSIWANLGSIDSSSNEVLRIISSMLEDANNKAFSSTIDVATDLMTAIKKLKFGESVQDLYEKYKGKRTGYAVRKVNFGQFIAEYDQEMVRINSKFGLPKDNRKAPDDPNDRVAWNLERNKWLSEHCERKYTSDYYEAWAEVPQCAKDALDSINTQISNILVAANAIDENGYRHFDKLNDLQWKEYNRLLIERKFLYSDRDLFGNIKQEGDVDYEIKEALLKLQQRLYPNQEDDRIRAEEAWKQARENVILDCGGRANYERYLEEGPIDGFDDNKLRLWDIRNTIKVFSKEDGRNVWDAIEEEFGSASPSFGPKYDELTKLIKDLLKPYRLQNKEVMADEMTEAVKNTIKSLYEARNQIRQLAINNNASLKSKSELYKKIYEKYIRRVENDYIKTIKNEMFSLFTDEDGMFDEDGFWISMLEYGSFSASDEGLSLLGLGDLFRLSSWNEHIEAKNFEKYMDLKPGDGWIERTDESKHINPNFDENFGSTMVPKESLYKNKQWDKIQKSPTLKNMYDLTIKTIHDSNELQTNRVHTDDYLLPQVMASSMRRIVRSRWGFLKEALNIIKEKLGIKEDPNDYLLFGEGLTLDDYDVDGNIISSNKKTVGNYADGRSYNTIPQYYTRRLEDPSMISSDLVNMLISYYRMSKLYSEKSKIKDDCEAIVDKLENSEFIKQSSMNGSTEVNGAQSATFNAGRKFLDMLLYGQYQKRFSIGNLEVSIALQTLKQYTTAVNLGMNPKVAAVGFMTSMWTHLINAVTGQKYEKADVASAFTEVIYRVGRNLFGLNYINNHRTNDKLMLLMELFNISNLGEKKGEHSNRNVLIQGLFGNLTFGFLSTFDFLAKSNILVSTMKAHRFVDGEFLTRDDIERMRVEMGEEQYNKKLKAWKKGKRLYSIFNGKNYKLLVDSKYEKAWKKCQNLVKDRVEKYSEDADGMATPLQKALMSLNFVGSFFLIHRQYLGLMLQLRWGSRVYDYDTHQYKNSIFKTAFDYGMEIFKNNCFGGGLFGAALGFAVTGAPGAVFGGTLGFIGSLIYKARHLGQNRKSYKQINEEFFGTKNPIFGKIKNPSNKKQYLNQRQNWFDIKRIIAEVAIYNFLISPVANYVAQIADDDDEDKWWLQMAAYWLRAFLWEAYASYRPTELLGAIKSATAATSPIDKIENVFGSVIGSIAPQAWFNVLYPSTLVGRNILSGILGINDIDSENESYYDEELSSGAYSYNEFADIFFDEKRGWTRREQGLFKLHPFHNLYEQFKDSKRKRQYIENQIMHVKEDGSSGNSISDIINYLFEE